MECACLLSVPPVFRGFRPALNTKSSRLGKLVFTSLVPGRIDADTDTANTVNTCKYVFDTYSMYWYVC
jgi:hypothetical protein